MSKRNNKGFTLVELIIAMSILSIVLTLGYNVITGTNKVTTNQMEVFSEQQGANLVNLYLTKDLEQVREFIPADTSLNPYTYILKDDVDSVEKIEYEVKKSDDGKFYTLTRKTSSGSIELLSDYPTSSEVPFSISKINKDSNIFKVVLNGKGKDFEVGKYEFEVVSRLENVLVMDDTSEDEVGKEEDEVGKEEDEVEKEEDEVGNPNQEEILNGRINFKFSPHVNNGGNTSKNHFNLSSQVAAFFNPDPKNKGGQYPDPKEKKQIKKNSNDVYTIEIKVPTKFTDTNTLGISVTNCGWALKDDFIESDDELKKLLKESLINEGIQIYHGSGIIIDGIIKTETGDVEFINNRYRYLIKDIDKSKGYVKLTFNIKVIDYVNQSTLTILFGKYNEDLTIN